MGTEPTREELTQARAHDPRVGGFVTQALPAARLAISDKQLAHVEEHARAVYPEECCGMLVGARSDGTVALSVDSTPNLHRARARDRYEVDPSEILRVGRAAERQGQEIVGFYHSHPDHPPCPSAGDTERAWPGYVYLIVGVGAGGRTETKAWTYDEGVREFREQPIESDCGARASGASEQRQLSNERRPKAMPITVRIPSPFQPLVGGKANVEASGGNLKELLADLEAQFPGIRERLYDNEGKLRRFVNLYVNDEDVRSLEGEDTALNDGDEVSIIPAIAGGLDPAEA